MFDRQSGQVRVGNEIAGGLSLAEYALENGPVLITRLNHPHAGLTKPALHAFDSFLDAQRTPM